MLSMNTTRLNELTSRYDTRFAELDSRPSPTPATHPVPEPVNPADEPAKVIVVDTARDTERLPPPPAPHRTVTILGLSPASLRKTLDPTGVLEKDVGYGPRIGMATTTASEGPYTLPTGHFGSGLGGPSTPIQSVFRPARRDTTAENAHAAHMTGSAGCQQRLAMGPPADPYTPSRPPPQPPQITPPLINPTYDDEMHGRPSSPGIGGPILLPRAHQDRTRGVNCFDIEALAHPLYHGKADSVPNLTKGFLANCGYNMLSLDDVVGSLNKIITTHHRILDTWHNSTSNTYGPQIDRILLKSFKLFPTLKSLRTDDVVNFYD